MKKAMLMFAVAAVAAGAFARPHGGPRHGGFGGHGMPPPRHHYHHHHSGWGRGGGAFWGGFVGGLVGGAVVDAYASPRYTETVVVQQTPVVVQQQPVVVQQTPVVVQQQPVVVQQTTSQVWVEGRYIDQVQANGTVVRVWQPGHYEVRTVAY